MRSIACCLGEPTLDDDAWNKVTSLPLLVRSVMNVHINQHHPEDKAQGLLYSIKYELKPEPATMLATKHENDDQVTRFFKGQLVSVAAAAAFLLEDPLTQCTLATPPLLFPSWHLDDALRTQGFCRRYVTRLPCSDMDTTRPGSSRNVPPTAFNLSVLLATVFRFVIFR